MYIRKQPSGSTNVAASASQHGRGSYEISGEFGPFRAADLINHVLLFEFGRYGYKATENVLRKSSGKKRIVLTDKTAYIHGARQVQGALLFPKSRRDEHGLLGGRPTIRLEQYIMLRMNFRGLTLTDDSAQVQFGNLDLWNGSQEDAIDFATRMREVELLHDKADKFPAGIAKLLHAHRKILESPNPIPVRAEEIVRELMDQAEGLAPDYNIDYVSGIDVMEPLQEILNEPHYDDPIPIESIPPEDVEIRLREVARWRRWAAARGPEAAAFRRKVRDAYNSTCVVCGIRYPVSQHCRVPGVDSAHVLPWATHDMDIPVNGLCLCKLHHWAFDQHLITITHENGQYHVKVTKRAQAALGPDALAVLESVAGEIPRARLPREIRHWPRPEFLQAIFDMRWD